MAQVEAGKAAVEYREHVNMVNFIKEHLEHAGRYGLLLEYITALKDGTFPDDSPYTAKLLVNATPEELTT